MEEQSKAEQQRERSQVEVVFGLTGGELCEGAWQATERDSETVWTFHHYYEFPPEYAERDFDSTAHSFRTVVRSNMFGEPPEQLAGWTKVATFGNSGEAECPGQHEETNLVRAEQCAEGSDRCFYCEAQVGEAHGYVYIGDGWAEVVYQLEEPSGAWIAGYNMPGYLPEMEPTAFADFESARSFIQQEMLDQSQQVEDLDEATALDHAAQELSVVEEADWDDIVGNCAYWITFDSEASAEDDN